MTEINKSIVALRHIFLASICIIMVSCSTSTNIVVEALPGTEIYNTHEELLAVADGSGRANIKMNNAGYDAFLLSHVPSSNDFIPFALDYKKKNYPVEPILVGVGGTIGVAGGSLMLGSAIAYACGTEGILGLTLGGLAAMFGGTGIGTAAYSRTEYSNHDYRYVYLERQRTNQDINITYPVFIRETVKQIPTEVTSEATTAKKKLKSSNTSETSSASSKKIGSSTSSKTLKDNAAKVEGTYVGTGSLTQNKSVIENYNDITVTITKSAKDVVKVNVIESGEKFFDSDGEYAVKKLSDGKYELTLKNVSSAKITIDTKNNLVYIHPRVNIEGDIYSLSIKAKKN